MIWITQSIQRAHPLASGNGRHNGLNFLSFLPKIKRPEPALNRSGPDDGPRHEDSWVGFARFPPAHTTQSVFRKCHPPPRTPGPNVPDWTCSQMASATAWMIVGGELDIAFCVVEPVGPD